LVGWLVIGDWLYEPVLSSISVQQIARSAANEGNAPVTVAAEGLGDAHIPVASDVIVCT
jgi:hypothetical protein